MNNVGRPASFRRLLVVGNRLGTVTLMRKQAASASIKRLIGRYPAGVDINCSGTVLVHVGGHGLLEWLSSHYDRFMRRLQRRSPAIKITIKVM